MIINRAAERRPILDVRTPAAAASRGGSTKVRSATRRPTGTRAAAAAGHGSGNDAHASGGGDDHLSVRNADFAVLIDRAVSAILAAGDRADPVFGSYTELNSLVRAVTYHEGKLLEYGMARLVAENPSLSLMPPETALPIVPAATEMLKRNDWSTLKGIRLSSEVHYRTSYTPDLFIVDHQNHSALILDVKRSLHSYAERRLNALRNRMMAAALIAGDWLHIEGRVAGVSTVGVAIIDGSSERRDRENGIFALDEIADLIGVPDAGEAMLQLRAKFACRVQEEVRAVCIRAVQGGAGTSEAGVPADDHADGEPSAPVDEDEDDEARGDNGSIGLSDRHERMPIVVGFACGGAP